ncbi:MAG: hypothetical protein KBT03_11040 [Bacteroidales bacterium]|nr:hypothetical protein [Candidatus Scybalousia scybalohippi]
MPDFYSNVTEEQFNMIPDIIDYCFPLSVNISKYGDYTDSTYENGDTIMPMFKASLTKKGDQVNPTSVSVYRDNVSVSDVSISDDKKSFTCPSTNVGVSYKIKVSAGSTKESNTLSWGFSEYRYIGQLTDVTNITESVIKSLSKSFSTSATATGISIDKGKYLCFAVIASSVPSGKKLVFQDATTGAYLNSETQKKVVSISRVNNSATNSYYVIYTNVAAGAAGKLNVAQVNE